MHKNASAVLGARLRQVRRDRRLTVDTLAERAGVSVRTVINIESGQWNPRLDIIESLAQALDLTVADLVADDAA